MKSHLMKSLYILFHVVLLVPTLSHAAYIVDTGIPLSTASSTLNTTQWLAGRFTITESYLVDSVEGWMFHNGAVSTEEFGTLTLAIYEESGFLPLKPDPATDTEIFSGTFSVQQTLEGVSAWHGISGMNLSLTPGMYWMAFEVRDGQSLDGGMWDTAPPNPLEAYAHWFRGNQTALDLGYVAGGGFWAGFRVAASPVPIPPALYLFGSGLIGLLGMARRKARLEK